MSYQAFHDLFPEIAERETRCITVLDESASRLPRGQYLFHEMFCTEHGCDCRRVFFYVVSSLRNDVEAVVAWGWESRAFYAKWLHDGAPNLIDDLKGPCLNLSSPQTVLAPAILELTQNILLKDNFFVERVKRHYYLFKGKINGRPVASLVDRIQPAKFRARDRTKAMYKTPKNLSPQRRK